MKKKAKASPDSRALVRDITKQLHAGSRVLADTISQAGAVEKGARLMLQALRKGRKVIAFGNGGSAGDAQHFAAELAGRYARNRPPIDAVALSVNTSALTAIANDFGYDDVFSRQLEAHARPGDVAVAISTSGDSRSVLQAVRAARRRNVRTIGLTGAGGGRLRSLADLCVRVPSETTARIQEGHIAILHIWACLIEDGLYPKAPRAHL